MGEPGMNRHGGPEEKPGGHTTLSRDRGKEQQEEAEGDDEEGEDEEGDEQKEGQRQRLDTKTALHIQRERSDRTAMWTFKTV